MSIVEHPKVKYEDISSIRKDKYSMIAEMIHKPYNELVEKKCCDNCRYFDEDCCDEDVSNVYAENLIKDSDTFYCSYHKFKV